MPPVADGLSPRNREHTTCLKCSALFKGVGMQGANMPVELSRRRPAGRNDSAASSETRDLAIFAAILFCLVAAVGLYRASAPTPFVDSDRYAEIRAAWLIGP